MTSEERCWARRADSSCGLSSRVMQQNPPSTTSTAISVAAQNGKSDRSAFKMAEISPASSNDQNQRARTVAVGWVQPELPARTSSSPAHSVTRPGWILGSVLVVVLVAAIATIGLALCSPWAALAAGPGFYVVVAKALSIIAAQSIAEEHRLGPVLAASRSDPARAIGKFAEIVRSTVPVPRRAEERERPSRKRALRRPKADDEDAS